MSPGGRILGSFALQHAPPWTKQGAASLLTLGPASEPAHGVWDAPGVFMWDFLPLKWLQMGHKWFLQTLQIDTLHLKWPKYASNRPKMDEIGPNTPNIGLKYVYNKGVGE